MCRSSQSSTLPLWSGRPIAVRTQGVRAYESAVVVRIFLIGCAVFLMAGASGVLAEASNKEETRCEGTRKTNVNLPGLRTTNDLPGCPKGGLLLGTDKPDKLDGKDGGDEVSGLGGRDEIFGGDGDDEVRGLGGADDLQGELGNDIIYGGDGNDELESGKGEDVLYGGDGNDFLVGAYSLGQRDKLYCGEGKDQYIADNNDYVDSSCETYAVGGGA
jgi:hypothetical protein